MRKLVLKVLKLDNAMTAYHAEYYEGYMSAHLRFRSESVSYCTGGDVGTPNKSPL